MNHEYYIVTILREEYDGYNRWDDFQCWLFTDKEEAMKEYNLAVMGNNLRAVYFSTVNAATGPEVGKEPV